MSAFVVTISILSATLQSAVGIREETAALTRLTSVLHVEANQSSDRSLKSRRRRRRRGTAVTQEPEAKEEVSSKNSVSSGITGILAKNPKVLKVNAGLSSPVVTSQANGTKQEHQSDRGANEEETNGTKQEHQSDREAKKDMSSKSLMTSETNGTQQENAPIDAVLSVIAKYAKTHADICPPLLGKKLSATAWFQDVDIQFTHNFGCNLKAEESGASVCKCDQPWLLACETTGLLGRPLGWPRSVNDATAQFVGQYGYCTFRRWLRVVAVLGGLVAVVIILVACWFAQQEGRDFNDLDLSEEDDEPPAFDEMVHATRVSTGAPKIPTNTAGYPMTPPRY